VFALAARVWEVLLTPGALLTQLLWGHQLSYGARCSDLAALNYQQHGLID
jgi:hypothetical protein